jgi:hypothetical protein
MLAEMAMAAVLVTAYEELLVDLDRAESSGDEFIVIQTRESLEYFERRVMLNPRLLHLWRDLGKERSNKIRACPWRITNSSGHREFNQATTMLSPKIIVDVENFTVG